MICKGFRRDGEPCGNDTKAGNTLCFWHAKGEQAKSKRDLALNLRTATPSELALLLQRETRKFIRDKNYPINRLHELRRSLETIATFDGKKLKPLDKQKKHLTLDERIKIADDKEKLKSQRRIK